MILKVGDKITRKPINPNHNIRKGIITKVYHSYRTNLGESLIMYAVKWDDTGKEESGYIDIANGLELDSST